MRPLLTRKTLAAGAAATALIGAFLIDTVPSWLRFGADDQAAAANTIRVILLVIAVAILLIALLRGSGLWVDTLVFTAVGLIVIAAIASYVEARPQNTTRVASRLVFNLPIRSIDASQLPAESRSTGADVVLLVVRREAGENGATTIATRRYKAKLSKDFPHAWNGVVPVSIERGSDDAQARDLANDLEQLQRIYLLPKAD